MSWREWELVEARGLRQAVDDVEGLDRLSRGALDQVVLDADGEDPAGPRVEALAQRDDRQLLLDLGDVPVATDAVRLDALVDLAEEQVRLGLAAGARNAALGVDHEVRDEPGPGERRQREHRHGRVATR